LGTKHWIFLFLSNDYLYWNISTFHSQSTPICLLPAAGAKRWFHENGVLRSKDVASAFLASFQTVIGPERQPHQNIFVFNFTLYSTVYVIAIGPEPQPLKAGRFVTQSLKVTCSHDYLILSESNFYFAPLRCLSPLEFPQK
jgi:hypothetical protein